MARRVNPPRLCTLVPDAADAVYHNLDILRESQPRYVVVLSGDFGALMALADRYGRLEVRTNAATRGTLKLA